MTTPSESDGTAGPAGESTGDAPFLPPARPVAAPPTDHASAPPSPADTPPASGADAPFLPSAAPPAPPAPSANPAAEPAFDAKAMVESQKHFNANPAYGPMPKGTDEGRAAARKLREQANRKRRRNQVIGRLMLALVVAGLAVGGYFAYQAFQDEQDEDDSGAPAADGQEDASDGEGGALTPLGEQEQVIEALDDVNSGARPSAGGLLDAVEEARDVVGQAEPPVGAPGALLVADVFTPAVLDHTDVLDDADGFERFVVRTGDLVAINPSAHEALVGRLLALPQVPADDAQLAVAPVVLPGDIGIAIQRDGDQIVRIVAVAADPEIHAVGP